MASAVTVQQPEVNDYNLRAPVATLGALRNPRELLLHLNCTQIFARPINTSAFYKRGCQEKYFARDWRERRNSSLASSPCVGVRIRDFPISADSSRWRDDVIRLLTRTSSVVVRCQPWFYLRLEAYSFFWLSEGAYG